MVAVAAGARFGVMLTRGEFRSVTTYKAPHRGVWMFAVGDSRSVWDGALRDISLAASDAEAKSAAEEIVRRDWGVSRLVWRPDKGGSWTAVSEAPT